LVTGPAFGDRDDQTAVGISTLFDDVRRLAADRTSFVDRFSAGFVGNVSTF
jgi:hypothetical protein